MSKWLGILLISAIIFGGCGNEESVEDVIIEVEGMGIFNDEN